MRDNGKLVYRDARGRFTRGNTIASIGGRVRAAKLTPRRRTAIARKGYQAMVARHFGGDDQVLRRYLGELGTCVHEVQAGAFRPASPLRTNTQDAKCSSKLIELGVVVKTVNGDLHKSPFWMPWQQAVEVVRVPSSELDLSLMDRARLAAVVGVEEQDNGAGAAPARMAGHGRRGAREYRRKATRSTPGSWGRRMARVCGPSWSARSLLNGAGLTSLCILSRRWTSRPSRQDCWSSTVHTARLFDSGPVR